MTGQLQPDGLYSEAGRPGASVGHAFECATSGAATEWRLGPPAGATLRPDEALTSAPNKCNSEAALSAWLDFGHLARRPDTRGSQAGSPGPARRADPGFGDPT